MTTKRLKEIIEFLETEWGEAGSRVIELCWNETTPMSVKEFLSHCTCCGGDWGAMFLTGIKELNPKVWYAIPEKMGPNAFVCITMVLELMGINFN